MIMMAMIKKCDGEFSLDENNIVLGLMMKSMKVAMTPTARMVLIMMILLIEFFA